MDELVQLLTPDLYRKNLFRVLQLRVTASARDVQRREERRQMELKIGNAQASASDGPLTLTPPPNEEALKVALQQLRTPVKRYLAELFWLWPSPNAADKTLALLEAGDLAGATKLWSSDLSAPDAQMIARHNLAVLVHMQALDAEAQSANGKVSKSQADGCQILWQRALVHWRDLLADDDFWRAASVRATAFNDPRLTTEVVGAIREDLAPRLLSINVRIAITAAEQSDKATIGQHMKLVAASGFNEQQREDAIRIALEPLQEQIRQAIKTAKANWRRSPRLGNRHIRAMHGSCGKALSLIDSLFESEKTKNDRSNNAFVSLSASLHDTVANAILEGQIQFGKVTNDWVESISLLQLARSVAVGEFMRSKLDENIKTVKENEKSANDWCAPGYWDLPESTLAVFEAARERARLGDFDGALAKLVPLDLSIGRPLVRSAAYCLSHSAGRTANAAISEYNAETPTQKRLLEKMTDERNIMLLVNRPSPSSPSYLNPPCPLCGTRSFTRWSEFELRGVPMWLCVNCGDKVREELKGKRPALRNQIVVAVERIKLAAEIDTIDPGVAQTLSWLLGQARSAECEIPGTTGLKSRLDPKGSKVTNAPIVISSGESDLTCFFCRKGTPKAGAEISLPICGDVQSEKRLFGATTTIKTSTLSVSRCARCQEAHKSTPASQAAWVKQREEAVRVLRSPKGLDVFLGRRSYSVGALTCLAVGFLARDGRGGVDLSGLTAAVADRLQTNLAGVDTVLPMGVGLLLGLTVTGILSLRLRHGLARHARNLVQAEQDFVARHPMPLLPPDISPETSYVQFPKLQELLNKQWSFGHVYNPTLKTPINVKGLVAASA